MPRSTSRAPSADRQSAAERIARFLAQRGELALLIGFDDCILGICERFEKGGRHRFVCYDREKVIRKLMQNGKTREEAEKYHERYQSGEYAGPDTPAFLIR